MNCKYCKRNTLIRKGLIGIKQRYLCKSCGKYQQDVYTYKRYNAKDDKNIKQLNAEGVGIRSMGRILGYSPSTIIRRIKYLASKVAVPFSNEDNQVYELDEMWTYVGKNTPSHYSWITYAINRKTKRVMGVAFGARSRSNLSKVVNLLKAQNPRKIVTDKLSVYVNLVKPVEHDTSQYSNNHIERGNLILRTHVKRLFRKTICFSRSKKMLRACVLLYLEFYKWTLKME